MINSGLTLNTNGLEKRRQLSPVCKRLSGSVEYILLQSLLVSREALAMSTVPDDLKSPVVPNIGIVS